MTPRELKILAEVRRRLASENSLSESDRHYRATHPGSYCMAVFRTVVARHRISIKTEERLCNALYAEFEDNRLRIAP